MPSTSLATPKLVALRMKRCKWHGDGVAAVQFFTDQWFTPIIKIAIDQTIWAVSWNSLYYYLLGELSVCWFQPIRMLQQLVRRAVLGCSQAELMHALCVEAWQQNISPQTCMLAAHPVHHMACCLVSSR